MTLPFVRSKERSYQCYICGLEFTDYNEFRTHIVSEHVEGREYILCDLCSAPIRDKKLHFSIKHKGIEMPKNGQTRAIIFYDFSSKGTRKRSHKKPHFAEGYMLSIKSGEAMHYRSGYELQVYEAIDNLNEIARWEVEPKDCSIPYFYKKKWHKYNPDLKVIYIDSSVEVWEIKPANQTSLEQNTLKFEAAAEMCERKGYKFCVKTEKGIKDLQKLVLEQNKSSETKE